MRMQTIDSLFALNAAPLSKAPALASRSCRFHCAIRTGCAPGQAAYAGMLCHLASVLGLPLRHVWASHQRRSGCVTAGRYFAWPEICVRIACNSASVTLVPIAQ